MTKTLGPLVFLAFLLSALPASAQTHPCDQPQLSGTVNITGSFYNFTVCAPLSEGIDGIYLYVNGVRQDLGTVLAQGLPNAAGKVAYFVSASSLPNGTSTIRTSTYTTTTTGVKQEGPLSVPFDLSREKAAPASAPTNHTR